MALRRLGRRRARADPTDRRAGHPGTAGRPSSCRADRRYRPRNARPSRRTERHRGGRLERRQGHARRHDRTRRHVAAAGLIAAAGRETLARAAAVTATGAIASSGISVVKASAVVDATAAIATVGRETLARAAAVTASPHDRERRPGTTRPAGRARGCHQHQRVRPGVAGGAPSNVPQPSPPPAASARSAGKRLHVPRPWRPAPASQPSVASCCHGPRSSPPRAASPPPGRRGCDVRRRSPQPLRSPPPENRKGSLPAQQPSPPPQPSLLPGRLRVRPRGPRLWPPQPPSRPPGSWSMSAKGLLPSPAQGRSQRPRNVPSSGPPQSRRAPRLPRSDGSCCHAPRRSTGTPAITTTAGGNIGQASLSAISTITVTLPWPAGAISTPTTGLVSASRRGGIYCPGPRGRARRRLGRTTCKDGRLDG